MNTPESNSDVSERSGEVVELRQYTLYPNKRDQLIDIFENHFIESQESEGIKLIGQFRRLDEPDQFVWLRGFEDMQSRAKSLSEFYGGPVWRTHRDTANETMLDSDNVLLLRPVHGQRAFPYRPERRSKLTDGSRPAGLTVITIYSLNSQEEQGFPAFFNQQLQPLFSSTGATTVALYETEPAANSFPALPIRENEHVFVWATWFTNMAAYQHHLARLSELPEWRDRMTQQLGARLSKAPDVLLLEPTQRSQWRGL